MQIPVYAADFETQSGALDLKQQCFDREYNEALVHQLATTYMTNGRSGTKAQKTRAMVRGGGAKPWRQKGTGRARAGTISSPLWRKGGVTFAAVPKKYDVKINKKMYRSGMQCIISELLRNERLMVVENMQLATPRTKDALKMLSPLMGKGKLLIVVQELDLNLYLATRNLPNVWVTNTESLDPMTLLRSDVVAIDKSAMLELEEMLG